MNDETLRWLSYAYQEAPGEYQVGMWPDKPRHTGTISCDACRPLLLASVDQEIEAGVETPGLYGDLPMCPDCFWAHDYYSKQGDDLFEIGYYEFQLYVIRLMRSMQRSGTLLTKDPRKFVERNARQLGRMMRLN